MAERLSNIELLRIIAIFFVLIRHAGFYAIGMPDASENQNTQTFILTVLDLFSSVGVNVFILISGFFGIKYTARGLFKFIFQCLFYSFGIYILLLSLGIIHISHLGLAECLFLRKINWFPKAYLFLFILAPVLNAFVENTSERQLRVVLINFFVFQTIFGCISEATHFISLGYSVVSFIGLYLLARYVRLYPHKVFLFSKIKDFSIYFIISLVLSLLSFWAIGQNKLTLFWRIEAYCNPLIVISSLYLLLCFSKIRLQSKFVNKIAASTFAVYLLHSNPNVIDRYYTHTIQILNGFNGGLLYIFCFLVFVYLLAILIDQIRVLCWNKILLLANKLGNVQL